MTRSAPMERTRSRFFVLHTPVTFPPNTLAIWTAKVPTPPDAPLIRTSCPVWIPPTSRRPCSAVYPATGTAAAQPHEAEDVRPASRGVPVAQVERGRAHADQHLTVLGDRFLNLLELENVGRAEPRSDDRFHRVPFASTRARYLSVRGHAPSGRRPGCGRGIYEGVTREPLECLTICSRALALGCSTAPIWRFAQERFPFALTLSEIMHLPSIDACADLRQAHWYVSSVWSWELSGPRLRSAMPSCPGMFVRLS